MELRVFSKEVGKLIYAGLLTQSADHGVNVSRSVMLLQLDAFDGVVIFATNLARNYDEAFVRRILTHVEFTLPDGPCRTRLWSKLLPPQLPVAPNIEPEWLSSESEGLAGGHLVNALVQAASRAVERQAPHRQVTREDVLVEFAHVRQAIANVGAQRNGPITVQEEAIPLEQLPPDIKDSIPAPTDKS